MLIAPFWFPKGFSLRPVKKVMVLQIISIAEKIKKATILLEIELAVTI